MRQDIFYISRLSLLVGRGTEVEQDQINTVKDTHFSQASVCTVAIPVVSLSVHAHTLQVGL